MECDLGNITLHFEARGEGRPVLMIHGWSLNCSAMMADMEPIFESRPGWKRIYPNLPGHGHSPGPKWMENQDEILDVLLAFCDRVIGDERFLVAGVSAGAYLARGIIQRRGEQIDGLLLSVPLIIPLDDERTSPDHVSLFVDPDALADLRPGEEWFAEMAVVQSRELLEMARSEPAYEGGLGDLEFQERIRLSPKNYAYSFDVDRLETPFRAPTLIIAGRQDSVVGYQDAWQILENYPRGTFAVLDMAGHLLGFEQQELFRTLAAEWLDRVEIYREKHE
jgi:pimeloyl-ACP methyl ester carboxylesterase